VLGSPVPEQPLGFGSEAAALTQGPNRNSSRNYYTNRTVLGSKFNNRPTNTNVKKHLPKSYQDAVGFAPGRTSLVFTDNTYFCALKMGASLPLTPLPPVNPLIFWGKVIATILHNPELAKAAGLIRSLSIPIDPPTSLKSGGFIYFTLSPSSDAAGLLGQPDALKVYATRIPPLTAQRDIFTPVLFPVATVPPSADYDEVFEEVDTYDDG